MADKFDEALEEFRDALTNGEELEAALASVAADHDIGLQALRNRVTKVWGDLDSFGAKNLERQRDAIERDNEADIIARARQLRAKPLSEWTEEDKAVHHKAVYINRYWRS